MIALVIGVLAGYLYRKSAIEKRIGQSEEMAQSLVEDATRKAEEQKKEILLSAKEEVIRLKSELDKEVRDRRYHLGSYHPRRGYRYRYSRQNLPAY